MTKPFIFNIADRTAPVVLRSSIVTTIQNSGSRKDPSGAPLSVQIITSLPYGSNVLRHNVILGISGANNYFQAYWSPQETGTMSFEQIEATCGNDVIDDVLHRNEASILTSAQNQHARLFRGSESLARVQLAIDHLVKRAIKVDQERMISKLPDAMVQIVDSLISDLRFPCNLDAEREARADALEGLAKAVQAMHEQHEKEKQRLVKVNLGLTPVQAERLENLFYAHDNTINTSASVQQAHESRQAMLKAIKELVR